MTDIVNEYGTIITMVVSVLGLYYALNRSNEKLENRLTRQIDGLDKKIDNVKADLTKQIDNVERGQSELKIDLTKQIDVVKVELKEDISKLDNRIDRLEKGQMVLREAIVEVKASINHQNMHIYGYKPNEQETGKTEKRI